MTVFIQQIQIGRTDIFCSCEVCSKNPRENLLRYGYISPNDQILFKNIQICNSSKIRKQTHTVIKALLISMTYLLWTANQVSVHDQILIDCEQNEHCFAPLEFGLITSCAKLSKRSQLCRNTVFWFAKR